MNIGPGLKPRTYRWSNRSLCVRCCKVSSTRSNGCLKFGDIYPLDLKRVVDMHSSHHLLLKGSKTWTEWRKDRIANVVRRESKHKYYMSMSGQHNQIVTPLILRQKYQKGSFLEFFYQEKRRETGVGTARGVGLREGKRGWGSSASQHTCQLGMT